jgi:hypothetical protein
MSSASLPAMVGECGPKLLWGRAQHFILLFQKQRRYKTRDSRNSILVAVTPRHTAQPDRGDIDFSFFDPFFVSPTAILHPYFLQ